MSEKLLFIVNNLDYFLSHRLAVGASARHAGYDVFVAAPQATPEALEKLQEAGLAFYPLPLSRKGTNPLAELVLLAAIIRLVRDVRPSIMHCVTVKAYLYGGVAARICRVPGLVSAVAGLGILFGDTVDRKRRVAIRVLRGFLFPLYKYAFGHKNQCVIVQNDDDRRVLESWGVLPAGKAVLIRGAGVAIADYPCLPEPDGTPVISLAARLLRDKGVYDFVQAAYIVKARGIDADFRLIGAPDPGNPHSVTDAEIDRWRVEGVISALGFRTDIAALYAGSHIICLPSYYREGLPKALIEGAACGRAVVTTDHPGCRDAILPGKTGMLVPPRNPAALADALCHLIEHPDIRQKMGREGRRFAEENFAIEHVISEHLRIYHDLCDGKNSTVMPAVSRQAN